jgi:hypothetical protein
MTQCKSIWHLFVPLPAGAGASGRSIAGGCPEHARGQNCISLSNGIVSALIAEARLVRAAYPNTSAAIVGPDKPGHDEPGTVQDESGSRAMTNRDGP